LPIVLFYYLLIGHEGHFQRRNLESSWPFFFCDPDEAGGIDAMHIPDGFLSNSINLAAAGLSGLALAVALRKAKGEMEDREIPLVGVTAAFIFAAQMINFPVAGGTSGHFLGAALAAILLGPWISFIIMTLVLVLQCLGFADGGLTALGSNVLNMGLVGGAGVYYLFRLFQKLLPKTTRGFLAASALAAWSSVFLASLACAVELALSGTSPARIVIPAMAGFHALIGVGEALITTAILSAVLAARADLIRSWRAPQPLKNAV
jgi:cobalt/nickel transport system permease protein